MTDASGSWSQRRRGLLAQATAAADGAVDGHDRLPVTSASPGFGGLLGDFLEERQAERRERGRAFLAASRTPPDGRVWERIERVLEKHIVERQVVLRLSPVLLVATPTHLPQPYRIGAAGVLLDMGLDLEVDELVIASPRRQQAPAEDSQSALHIAPLDLECGFEQDRYCQLRCEAALPDVAADIVRLVLRK